MSRTLENGRRISPPAQALQFGAFVLTGKLASDGVASCYVAHPQAEAGAERQVLLRVLHGHLAEVSAHYAEFVAEGTAGMALGLRGEVPVLAVGAVDGLPYWVVELAAGTRRALVPEPEPASRPLERWLPL